MAGSYLKAKRGDDLPQSKMNAKLVAVVRAEHANKERLKRQLDDRFSAKALAARYGISKSAMEKILTFQTWKHAL